MGIDAPWHWAILALIVIAVFGTQRLPDAARSLGRSLRIFTNETKSDPQTSTQPELTADSEDAWTSTSDTPCAIGFEADGPAPATPHDLARRPPSTER